MVQPTYPGVYLQEKSAGPGPITGVSTSNLGLVGFTTRGICDYPTLCTSYADFAAKFGGFTGSGLAPTEAYAFFANGGQRLYMVRTVHSDAASASVYWSKAVTAEVLTSTAQPTGIYSLDTNKVPVVAVVPGTVRVEFQAAVTNNIFQDDGLGTMAFVAAGSGGAGGSGSIDYETGEIRIQLTTPGNFAGGAYHVVANYSYKVATFGMRWPGVAGNLFRVQIVGSPEYFVQATASYTAFKITVEENIGTTSAVWQVNETFDEVVLDDPTDAKYFKTIMNDPYKGSQYVEVTDYGNAQDVADLAGTAVTSEDFSGTQTPAYDGTTKQFTYTMANAVAPGTLEARFKFREIAYRIGTGDGTATPATVALGAPVDAGDGTVGGAKVQVRVNLTAGGWTVLYDNGAGSLKSSPFPGTTHGTVTYTTGTVALNISGTTVVAGSAITITCTYEDVVTVTDDANGAMAVATPAVGVSPPTKFQLNSSGTNTIDYDSGDMILTWKITGEPAAGPAGVGASTGATAAFKVGAAEPYSLTPGTTFTLDVDNVGGAVVTFDAAAGYQQDTTVYPVADQDGLSVIISIDGASQTVTFSGATTTAAGVINQMNAQLVGAYAVDNAGHVRVVSDTKGTASTVLRTGGTSALTWAAAVAGTGDVADITAVTALEVEARIEADTTAEVTVNGDGTYTIYSPTTGPTSELDFTAGAALTALGLLVETIVGTTGTTTNGEEADYYTQPDEYVRYTLTGGLDGSATTRSDVTAAALEAGSEGLYALKLADEIMQVVIADFQTDDAVCRDVITFCENMGDKFAIFTVPEGLDEQEAVNWRKFTLAQYSNKAALYYPHIRITDPVTESTANLPCGGHVAGIYAKTDNNKNVGKAPAGVEDGKLGWLEGFEVDLSRPQVGYAYENKINCLVGWPQTGQVVWGARTLEAPGGEFPYIQQRRLFQFVEKSVFNSTHIHVFQNNGPALWAAITLQVTNFLMTLFKAGYLAGTTPEEAFFVVCDETNNPQITVDLGLVYCDVGLATNKPAEFAVFSFSQLSIK